MSIAHEAENLKDHLFKMYEKEVRTEQIIDYTSFSGTIQTFEHIDYSSAKTEIIYLDRLFHEEMKPLFAVVQDVTAPIEVKRILMDAKE